MESTTPQAPETPSGAMRWAHPAIMPPSTEKYPSISIKNKYEFISTNMQRRYPWILLTAQRYHQNPPGISDCWETWFRSSLLSHRLYPEDAVQASSRPEAQINKQKPEISGSQPVGWVIRSAFSCGSGTVQCQWFYTVQPNSFLPW